MGKAHKPRSGSMQYWPRKRAKRHYARVRSWPMSKEAKLLGFAGYKVGMTHLAFIDNKKQTLTKGQEINCPVTIIECPPLKAASVRFYKKNNSCSKLVSEIFAEKLDKELERKINMPKAQKPKTSEGSEKTKKKIEDIKDYDDITILVYTQPKLTGIGKKKPEMFEIGMGGDKEAKLQYAKSILGKEISVKDIFKEGQQVDIHAVTKGKGFQGPVKRFGISIRASKSEKTKRGPGSLGGWKAQGHFMYRVAHAGQTGYHTRTHYNSWLLKISDKPEEINQKSGFKHYGVVKNQYILLKGSVDGSTKRLIRMVNSLYPNRKTPVEAPSITHITK